MTFRRCARKALFLVFGLFALAGLSGCEQSSAPFRVGTNIWIGYEPLYVAEHKGYFQDSPIRLVTMHNATEIQQALRSGVLEVAALTLDEALNLLQEGVDIRVVLVMDSSHGADVLMATPEIATLADLRGRRIGVESTAVGAVMLQGALEAAGLTPADVQVVDMGIQRHIAAYLEGRVDAVVSFEPVRSELLKSGAKVLFDSSAIPGRVIDVLVTTADIADRHGATLETLVAGHFRALEDYRASPMDTAVIMKRRQGMSPEEIVESYKGLQIPDISENHRYLSAPSPDIEEAAQRLAALMYENRLLRRVPDPKGIADDRFLPRQ
jgi:NitT/TauT family transport system substrate-binding protein